MTTIHPRLEGAIRVTATCLAPLSHGAFGESAGNATLIRRMTVVLASGMPRVPCVSGNALRGKLRREIMQDLLRRAGLLGERSVTAALLPDEDAGKKGKRWDRLYAAVANGGHLEAAEAHVEPEEIRALRELLPPLSVFGGALYSWLLPGHMEVGVMWPRCRETIEGRVVSDAGKGGGGVSAEDLIEELSHCRHVDREHQDTELTGVTPMPTTFETFCTGTVLESLITFPLHATPEERGSIAHGLDLLRHLGGKSGSGLGVVDVVHDGDAAPYRAWLDSCGDLRERLVGLAERLGARAEKPAKGGKKGKAATA